ncbi:MAG: selenocysteine-specific translation elongation factor [Brevefilum sp.]|nr:selenocysteine-specific translation elongation factor [Brevefilum sp.]
MQVIGTAGHVDHGKSTLINRLTGINPDRLKEEQDREMSIELGFAWFMLPNGAEIGIVDVPGHRDFIENMLAGIGGIDAVLFVVAADEGVMPQTREHLAILDLLQVPAGVVALTKVDLVTEPGWLDLVEAELRETLLGTVLENSPVVPVSARTGQGIDLLVQTLQEILIQHPHRPDLGRPRLPVDRVFTLPGFGTIVTGTLLDGTLSVGDDVQILPRGVKGRIRGLQTHKQAEQSAFPGSRTAVNVSGVSVDEVARGDVLAHPGDYRTTKMMDVFCTLLPDTEAPLRHNTEIKLFLGASEVMARARVLGVQECPPGGETFLQLMLKEPMVALRGDRFIIRRPSPPATIGGGQVVDPHPVRRHRRFNSVRLDELERLLMGTPEDILLQTALKLGPTSSNELLAAAGLEAEPGKAALAVLVDQGALVLLGGGRVIVPQGVLTRLKEDVGSQLSDYHQQFPLRLGMPRERLKSQIALDPKTFDALIAWMGGEGILVESGADLRLSEHQVKFSAAQQAQVDVLLREFEAQPYSPPSYKQSSEQVGEEVLRALITLGQLSKIGEDVLLLPQIFNEMRQTVINQIQHSGSITLAELRDRFDTSRKYAVAVLEFLDQAGVTVRRGDARVLARKS